MSNVIDIKSNPRALSHDDFDALVYLRLFEGCNLHCDHCFIPNNPKKMDFFQVNDSLNIMRNIVGDNGRVLLQWHGGEPTALGYNYLAKCLDIIEQGKHEMQIVHGIQTNLLNYESKWAKLYHEFFDSSVGVSWDYEIRKKRMPGGELSNSEFEKLFWPNVDRLVSDGIEPYFVITGTKVFFDRFKNPIELFEMLESHGVFRLHIERLTNVGYARDNWNWIGLSNLEYSNYMSRIYKAYKTHLKNNPHRETIRISPFDGLDESIGRLQRGEAGGYGCLSGACDSRYHTIDSNGYKKGCTALTSEFDNKRVSSEVQVIKFFDLEEERSVRQLSCEGCRYKPICSSGCLATDKFDYSNECSGSKKLFETIERINN